MGRKGDREGGMKGRREKDRQRFRERMIWKIKCARLYIFKTSLNASHIGQEVRTVFRGSSTTTEQEFQEMGKPKPKAASVIIRTCGLQQARGRHGVRR